MWLVVRALTGILCMFVTFHGGYSGYAMDFRVNSIVTVLYCDAQALSIFVFLFARTRREEQHCKRRWLWCI